MKDTRNWIKTNQGVGTIFLAVQIAFLIYLQLSPWVHREVRDGFTLGFFPVLAVVLMMIFSLILLFDKQRGEILKELETFTGKSFIGGILILIGTGCYFGIMEEIGFLIVTPCYLIIFIYLLGLKSWRTCVISSLIMTVTVYAAFSAIGVRIPAGVLEGVLFF